MQGGDGAEGGHGECECEFLELACPVAAGGAQAAARLVQEAFPAGAAAEGLAAGGERGEVLADAAAA